MSMVEPNNFWEWINGTEGGVDDYTKILSLLNSPVQSLDSDQNMSIPSMDYFQPKDVTSYHDFDMDIKLEQNETTIKLEQDEMQNDSLRTIIKLEQKEVQNETTIKLEQSPNSVLEKDSVYSSAKTFLSVKDKHRKKTRSKGRKPAIHLWCLVSSMYYSYVLQKGGMYVGEHDKQVSCLLSNGLDNNSGEYKKVHEPEFETEKVMDGMGPRRCTHCLITKTPQWREGPMGRRSLCNACGVRFRTGRLFPEYRPVASPTFVPGLHSNSHKRVLGMRKKAILQTHVIDEDPLKSL